MTWSQAGSSITLRPGPRWQDLPEDEKYKDNPFGDRRQELVFIGQNMKEIEIRKALDDALLSEMTWNEEIEREAKRARKHGDRDYRRGGDSGYEHRGGGDRDYRGGNRDYRGDGERG